MGRRLPVRFVLVPATLVAGLLAVAACSSGGDATHEPIAQSGSHGRIHVAVVPGEAGQHVTGYARFLRYRDADAELADLLIGPQPSPRELDVCEIATPEAEEAALASLDRDMFITHLDAGDLRVAIADLAAETLSPRHVPPLFPYVGGVEYEELTLHEPSVVPAAADVSVTGFGGRHVGGFDIVATLPAVAHNVWATTRVGANGSLDGVTIGWDPPAARGPDELVITVTQGIGRTQIRCLAGDTGRFVVPARVWEQLPDLDPEATEIWVDRLRRVPFAAPGIDWGELEVAVRYVVTTSAP